MPRTRENDILEYYGFLVVEPLEIFGNFTHTSNTIYAGAYTLLTRDYEAHFLPRYRGNLQDSYAMCVE